jgi:hypothetical protein
MRPDMSALCFSVRLRVAGCTCFRLTYHTSELAVARGTRRPSLLPLRVAGVLQRTPSSANQVFLLLFVLLRPIVSGGDQRRSLYCRGRLRGTWPRSDGSDRRRQAVNSHPRRWHGMACISVRMGVTQLEPRQHASIHGLREPLCSDGNL